jgi:hypothetical protein
MITFVDEAAWAYTQSKLMSWQAEHLGLCPSHYRHVYISTGYSHGLTENVSIGAGSASAAYPGLPCATSLASQSNTPPPTAGSLGIVGIGFHDSG